MSLKMIKYKLKRTDVGEQEKQLKVYLYTHPNNG